MLTIDEIRELNIATVSVVRHRINCATIRLIGDDEFDSSDGKIRSLLIANTHDRILDIANHIRIVTKYGLHMDVNYDRS